MTARSGLCKLAVGHSALCELAVGHGGLWELAGEKGRAQVAAALDMEVAMVGFEGHQVVARD